MNTVSFFQGAAIIKIIRYEEYHRIQVYNKYENAYIVNDKSVIYIKYSQKRLPPWNYTFVKEHVSDLTTMAEEFNDVFIVLICNEDGICCLNWHEFNTVISVENTQYPKWVSVSRMKKEKYSIWGRDGEIKYKIGNVDFPRKIFLNH